MSEHRIVFLGPVGAGKTTAIETVCSARETLLGAPFGLGIQGSSLLGPGVDNQQLNLSDGQSLQLLAASGADLSKTLRMYIDRGVRAIVILISNEHPEPLRMLREQLLQVGELAKHTRVVVAVTHIDVKCYPGPTVYSRELHKFQLFEGLEEMIPMLIIDPRDIQDMALLMETALYKRSQETGSSNPILAAPSVQ